jgi:drug/metabolite transporter (DMT)-like permease
MPIIIPILAVIGCALANGISTVCQKTGADEEAKVKSLDLMLLLRMLENVPYIWGIILGIVGWVLSLVALQVFPIFLVQSVMAASIVVTAIGERIVTHRALGRKVYAAILVVVVGLGLVGISARPAKASLGNSSVHLAIELAPIVLILLGVLFIYVKNYISATVLAILSGISFGGTSVVGRIIQYPHGIGSLLIDPLVWALVLYAVIGQYLFTVALQRASGTKINALMVVAQTLVPSALGLLYFDDKIRSNFEGIALIGAAVVIVGCIVIGRVDKEIPKNVAM